MADKKSHIFADIPSGTTIKIKGKDAKFISYKPQVFTEDEIKKIIQILGDNSKITENALRKAITRIIWIGNSGKTMQGSDPEIRILRSEKKLLKKAHKEMQKVVFVFDEIFKSYFEGDERLGYPPANALLKDIEEMIEDISTNKGSAGGNTEGAARNRVLEAINNLIIEPAFGEGARLSNKKNHSKDINPETMMGTLPDLLESILKPLDLMPQSRESAVRTYQRLHPTT